MSNLSSPQGQLPVCHVYFPTTFVQVLSSSLEEHRGKSCLLLGEVEVRPGKPVKSHKLDPSLTGASMAKSVDTIVNTSERGIRHRRDKTKSSSSRTSTGRKSEIEVEPAAVTDEFEGHQLVYAVNIVGITWNYDDAVQLRHSSNLKVVGEVSTGNGRDWGSNNVEMTDPHLSLRLFREGDNCEGQVLAEKVFWRSNWFYLGSRHVIMFDYDPVEFQQWKVPQGYPLGVPKVFLNGISMFQFQPRQEYNFTPAFPKIDQYHQNLNACSSPPSFVTSNKVVNFICSRSAGLQQISHKVAILIGSLLGNYPVFALLNFLLLLVIDSVIGYVISSYLLQLPDMLGLLHTTVDQMLARLNHLLRWLRGAPAGLKLNPNLNSLYWRFFSYHIHLWANYIGILEPIFAVILNTIQYFGVLGVTIQISLLKDLLSLATFHVYCLYIYATRLYSLQTTAIKALCRVFFGRKFNPLRNRIDHVQLTTSELFLSSFGFVILIFLFPTTMVYYTGFVFLRVPVLLLERLLQYLVVAFNALPFVSWALVYLKSPRVADEVYLMPRIVNLSGALTFRVCLRSTRTLFVPPDFGKGIKKLVTSVMDGTVLKE